MEPLKASNKAAVDQCRVKFGDQSKLGGTLADRIAKNNLLFPAPGRKLPSLLPPQFLSEVFKKNGPLYANFSAGEGGQYYCFSSSNPPVPVPGKPLAPLQAVLAAAYVKVGCEWAGKGDFALSNPFKNLSALTASKEKLPARIVLINGSIHRGGKELTEQELLHLGLERVKNDEGTPTVFPALVSGGRSLLIPGTFGVGAKRSADGGMELCSLNDPQAQTIVGPAIQLRGTGGEYVFHLAGINADGTVECCDHEAVLRGPGFGEGTQMLAVQDQRYAGKRGIFLDRQHEHYGDSPTGAFSGSATDKDMALDRILWAKGAEMDGIVLDALELVTAEDAQTLGTTLPCEELKYSVRLLFNDTRRLSDIASSDNSETPATDRDRYFEKVAETIGRNTRICLDNKLTVMTGLITLSNLGVYGGILDTENFRVMENRYQSLPLVESWLRDLHTLAVGKGSAARNVWEKGLHYSEQEFWTSRGLKLAIRAMTGCEDVDALIAEKYASANEDPKRAIASLALEVNSIIIASQLEAEGKQFNWRELVSLCKREPALASLVAPLWRKVNNKEISRADFANQACHLYVLLALQTHARAYLNKDRPHAPIPLLSEIPRYT